MGKKGKRENYDAESCKFYKRDSKQREPTAGTHLRREKGQKKSPMKGARLRMGKREAVIADSGLTGGEL